MKTGRKAAPAAEIIDVPMNTELLAQDFSAANELALVTAQQASAVRAVALQMGYQLPADCTDPDLIQRDISANMRRSVEACLEVGKGLRVLKEACAHGNFMARLDVLGIEYTVAARFMQSAAKFSNVASTRTLNAINNQTKLFEMLLLDDAQIQELELTGQTGELALDDVATMSIKELRAAVREVRKDKSAVEKVLELKNKQIDKLQLVQTLPPDEQLIELHKTATAMMHEALGVIRGHVRQALVAINDHPSDTGTGVFMAGLIGQIQRELTALRDEYHLPDVSSAEEQAVMAAAAIWSAPQKS
jgi:hypothetical protein